MWISCLLDTEHTDGQTAHLEHWTVQDGETSHRAAGDVNSTYQHRAGRASNGEESRLTCLQTVRSPPPATHRRKTKNLLGGDFFFLLFFFLLFYFICFFQSGWRGGGWRVEGLMALAFSLSDD